MKLRIKIFISIMTLLLVLTTFSTTTYAWFKINSQASVEGFDFTVVGGEGFLVSLDGKTYRNDLKKNDILNKIIENYDKEKYVVNDGKLCYVASGQELNNSQREKILEDEIQMLPLTSTDGITLKDLNNSVASTKSGRYYEFSVYFKATSNKQEDDMTYNIYLNDRTTKLTDGEIVNPTSIKSEDATEVILRAPMNTFNADGSVKSLLEDDAIKVYSSNALRFSTQDTSLESPLANIYELSDDSEYEYGSYASDYDGEDVELKKLYSKDLSAMYTYRNNLLGMDTLADLLPSYNSLPKTIRSLEDENPIITTVSSGSEAKLVTFRFWLEGWDADCFDGLAKSINVNLTFKASKVASASAN